MGCAAALSLRYNLSFRDAAEFMHILKRGKLEQGVKSVQDEDEFIHR